MNVNDFIEGFVAAENKEKYIKKHVVSTYANYEDKVSEAEKIVQMSCETEVDGEKRFMLNSPTQYILFVMAICKLYTDIEFDTLNAMVEFNLLEKNSIVEYLREAIGPDHERFLTIVNKVQEDYMINNRDLISYIERRSEALGMVLQQIVDELNKQIAQGAGE